jgi:GH18 family chitinase
MVTKKQLMIGLLGIGILIAIGVTIALITRSKNQASSGSATQPNQPTTTTQPNQPTTTTQPNNLNLKNMAGAYIPSWSYYRSGSGKFPTNYSNGTITIPNLPPNLDYIVYAFVLFDSDGNLNWGPNINVFNSDGKTINSSPVEQFDFDMVKYIGSLNTTYRFISVGGYNFSIQTPPVWSALIANKSSITNLANQLINMCKIYNLNGVDIDWEYPQTGELDTFINTAGPLFKSNNLQLTLATVINKQKIDIAYNFKNIDSYFSWYNLMSYDIYGNFPGSTTFGANTDFSYIKDTINYLINTKGINSNKIALGLASYGRYTRLTNYDNTKSALGQAITIVDPNGVCLSETGTDVASYSGYTADCLSGPYTKTVGYLSYYEIADLIEKTSSTPVYDQATESSYIVLQKNNVNMAISFDTPTNIVNKTKYALNNNMFGIFMWQLADDDFQNNYPISNTAISIIKNKSAPSLSSNRISYNIGTCGVAWENNNFPLNTVNSCSTFADPSTVGKGNLSCFGTKTCSPIYNAQCQISNSNSNLNYPPTGNFVAFGDFLNSNCGNVFYSGSAYGSQFYRDYVQTGRVKMCDCNGNTVSFNPDCSNATDVGSCMSSSLSTAPAKSTICLDEDISNCNSINLNCPQEPAQSSTAYNSDGSFYSADCNFSSCPPTTICSNYIQNNPICSNGVANPPAGLAKTVYVKDACGKFSPVADKDCKQYCA